MQQKPGALRLFPEPEASPEPEPEASPEADFRDPRPEAEAEAEPEAEPEAEREPREPCLFAAGPPVVASPSATLLSERMRRPAPPAKRPSRLLAGWARWLVLALSLLLVPVHASGVLHAVADVVVALVGEKLHQGKAPCSHEEQGERCPPGCPDCHCSLAAPALLPPCGGAFLVRTMMTPVVLLFHDATAPPRPVLSGIERPPRFARLA